MRCGTCDKTDGVCYTSNPPKVKCTITGKYHGYNDPCDAANTAEEVRKYEYLLAYHYAGGMGTAYSIRTQKIDSINEAIEVTKALGINLGFEDVGLINIQLLREFTE